MPFRRWLVRCITYTHAFWLPTDGLWLIEYNLSPSGEDMYSLMAVSIHALVSAWWKFLPHPRPLLTRWAGRRVESNLRPHDNRNPPLELHVVYVEAHYTYFLAAWLSSVSLFCSRSPPEASAASASVEDASAPEAADLPEDKIGEMTYILESYNILEIY